MIGHLPIVSAVLNRFIQGGLPAIRTRQGFINQYRLPVAFQFPVKTATGGQGKSLCRQIILTDVKSNHFRCFLIDLYSLIAPGEAHQTARSRYLQNIRMILNRVFHQFIFLAVADLDRDHLRFVKSQVEIINIIGILLHDDPADDRRHG